MTEMSEFPFDKLPQFGSFPLPILQEAVNEVLKAHRVPPKMAYYSAAAAACALAQMSADVHKPSGGSSPTGGYFLMGGKSGERKTKVDNCFFDELRKPGKAQRERYLDDLAAYTVREKIWNRKSKVLMNTLTTDYTNSKDTTAIEAAIIRHDAEKPKEPSELKLVYNDTTFAAFKNKMHHSPNATLLSSDGKKILEGFLLENDADINQLWSGEDIDVLRVTVASYTLSGVRFTFSVMLQNESLSRIMLGKGKGRSKGKEGLESGFFARVIFSDVGSTQGERLIDVIETTEPNLENYNRRVAELTNEYIEAIASGSYRRRLLRFSPETFRAWIAYFNYVESNIRAGGRYEKAGDHASKLADNVARVSAGLHVLEGFEGEIGMDCLLCAIALCDEASRDYMRCLAPKDEDEVEALALKDWLVKKYVKKLTRWVDLKEIINFAPNRMRSTRLIMRYLEILERGHYLVIQPGGVGGRTRAQVELQMDGEGAAITRGNIGFFEYARSVGTSRV